MARTQRQDQGPSLEARITVSCGAVLASGVSIHPGFGGAGLSRSPSRDAAELHPVGHRPAPAVGQQGRAAAARGGTETWALLVAAGAGERLGTGRPKAFAALAGRALLAESLERIDASPWVDAIVVAVPDGWEEAAIMLAEELVLRKVRAVVAGGDTRADSVRRALAEVPAETPVVIVHDAARPLVDDAVIERVLAPLGQGYEGAVPGLPLVDTVKRVELGVVAETLERGSLVAVQTPQAFVAAALRNAYEAGFEGTTDCASLVERTGGRVRVVEGERRLLKVTTAADLALVESWLGRRPDA